MVSDKMGIAEETVTKILAKNFFTKTPPQSYGRGVKQKNYLHSHEYYRGCGQIHCTEK